MLPEAPRPPEAAIRPSSRRRPAALAVACLLVGACLLGAWLVVGGVAARSGGSLPSATTYVVLPHPDDEFQAWSLLEHRPDRYEVLIALTHGEQSAYCRPDLPGYRPGIEPAPSPLPTGQGEPSCDEARLTSFRGFVEDMARADDSLPGSFTDLGTRGPFPTGGVALCRDDGDVPCRSVATARVWRDDRGRGALVVFDLGDGDLTAEEVGWALRTVRDQGPALGLGDAPPAGDVVGAYASVPGDGFPYPHPDHLAVRQALTEVDLGMGRQRGATSRGDPGVALVRDVGEASARTAFGRTDDGRAAGAHDRWYGWLWVQDDPPADAYPLDREGQGALFHTRQYFWER